MKFLFYRVHLYDNSNGSFGYEYFADRRLAEKRKRASGPDATVDTIEVEPTKRGILAALNIHASHADNG